MEHTTPGPTIRQVSVAEAARELGVSPETVRRRIKSGEIEARRAIRPQGTVWEVSLPLTTPRGVPPLAPVTGHTEASPSEPEHATPAEASHPSLRLAGHTADPAPLVASIARLIVELAEVRVISDRRADQLVSQAERIAVLESEIGSLRVEIATVRVAQAQQDANPGPVVPKGTTDAPAPRWRRLRVWLGVGLLAAVVGSASCTGAGAQAPAASQPAMASMKDAALCGAIRQAMARAAQLDLGNQILIPNRQLGQGIEALVRTGALVC